jgi:hypothetical protein
LVLNGLDRAVLIASATLLCAVHAARVAAEDEQDLARAARNPLANLLNVPLTYDANFGGGMGGKKQHVLQAEPVIPFSLGSDWSLITRTLFTLSTQPALSAGESRASGLGDIQLAAFVSPARGSQFVWGAGPVFQLPSATDPALGQGKWAAGPTAAALWFGELWTFGARFSNVWSFAGKSDRAAVNQMQLQPQINYNFPSNPNRYLSYSPIITADWKASGGERWTVPVSLGIGELVKFGGQSVNLQATAYYSGIRPAAAAAWTLEFQVQFLFPQ